MIHIVRRHLCAVLVLVSLLAASNASAAFDCFLKIDGIEGESEDRQFAGALDILSYSNEVTNLVRRTAGGGGGAGKVSFSDIHFAKSIDKASPQLMLACAKGQHIPKAILSCRKTGGDDNPYTYLTVTLQDCLVSSYSSKGEGNDIPPTDVFSLNFSKIVVEYFAQTAEGQSELVFKAGWDLKQNKAI